FAKQARARSSGCIEVSALYPVLNQFLTHADCLKVHSEDRRRFGFGSAKVILAGDLIQNGLHLQCVVALDILETIGPGGKIGTWVANRGAARAGRSADARKSDNVGVDLRGIVIVDFPARAGD